MAIQKTSATRLRKGSLPYTTLANHTVDKIKNTDALAIWTYLQTKPSGWIVRAGKIQEHFGIGRDKYRKAMAYLAEMNLVSYVSERDEGGHLKGTEIVIHCEPLDDREPEKPTVGESDTEALKNRPSGKPTVGESGSLVMEGESSNGMKSSNGAPSGEPEAKRRSGLPDDFQPNETCRSRAIQSNVSMEIELEKFKDFHLAKGSKFKDWQAAFRNWLTKAGEFQAQRGGNVSQFPQRPAAHSDDSGSKVYIPEAPQESYEEYLQRIAAEGQS